MMLHCFESTRALAGRLGLPALWSAGAHGALVLGAVATLHRGSAMPDATRETLFLLPLLPTAASVQGSGTTGPITFHGPGLTVPSDAIGTGLPVGGGQAGRGERVAAPESAGEDGVLTDSIPIVGPAIYTADQLDEPVERSAESAGPVYPEVLRQTNVEGAVIAEWVVDTVGTADPASFRVLESSHPLFSDAVRDVLPHMRFRPATLQGRHVRQLVRQQFRFEIDRSQIATARRDSTGS